MLNGNASAGVNDQPILEPNPRGADELTCNRQFLQPEFQDSQANPSNARKSKGAKRRKTKDKPVKADGDSDILQTAAMGAAAELPEAIRDKIKAAIGEMATALDYTAREYFEHFALDIIRTRLPWETIEPFVSDALRALNGNIYLRVPGEDRPVEPLPHDEWLRHARRNYDRLTAKYDNEGKTVDFDELTFLIPDVTDEIPSQDNTTDEQCKGVYTVTELRSLDMPRAEPIVMDLIQQGETGLLVGKPKAGKSRLMMQLALNISRGEPFLGHDVVGKHRILILDLENKPEVVKERFAKMSTASEADESISVFAPATLAETGVGLEGQGWFKLESIVDQVNPTILIVDTWRLLIGPVDENKSEKVLEGLKRLSQLRINRPQMVTIIVHHLRKQGTDNSLTLRADPYQWVESVSGHHALVGHVDWCYGLEREIDLNGEELIVFGGVARNAAQSITLLQEDTDTLGYEVVSGVEALKSILTPKEIDLFDAAKQAGKFSFTELVNKTKAASKKTVSSMLRKAETQGVIQKQGSLYIVRGG